MRVVVVRSFLFYIQIADLTDRRNAQDKADKNAFSNSENEFFGSPRDFKKNIYKQIEKKKLK